MRTLLVWLSFEEPAFYWVEDAPEWVAELNGRFWGQVVPEDIELRFREVWTLLDPEKQNGEWSKYRLEVNEGRGMMLGVRLGELFQVVVTGQV